MDDSLATWSPATLLGGPGDVALVVVVGLILLRVLPSSRRWAPRGNVRSVRPPRPDSTVHAGDTRVSVPTAARRP